MPPFGPRGAKGAVLRRVPGSRAAWDAAEFLSVFLAGGWVKSWSELHGLMKLTLSSILLGALNVF